RNLPETAAATEILLLPELALPIQRTKTELLLPAALYCCCHIPCSTKGKNRLSYCCCHIPCSTKGKNKLSYCCCLKNIAVATGS
ncbi:hypothetical protein GIB67_027652, partial [Kingdonia uniflora]